MIRRPQGSWHEVWCTQLRMSRTAGALLICGLTLIAAGCKEGGTITVHSLKFNGVKSVDLARLTAGLRSNGRYEGICW